MTQFNLRALLEEMLTVAENIREKLQASGEAIRQLNVASTLPDPPADTASLLGALGGVFDQDMANLPFVQEGLKMMGNRIPVQFAKYTEIRLRQLHRTLQRHIDA